MRPPNTKESLLERTLMQDGHWLFQDAPHGPTGHCKVRWNGKKIFIHRISAYLHWGFDLESSALILHRCEYPNCWNPEHLYEGTQKDNVADSIEAGTFKNVIAEEEHNRMRCQFGHPLDGMRSNGKRYCLTCNRIRVKYGF